MNKIVNVTAQAFNAKTGKALAKARTEPINLESNPMFKNCKTLLDVKDVYEGFWNHLNAHPKEIVLVQQLSWK